jgi:hypothetical protein
MRGIDQPIGLSKRLEESARVIVDDLQILDDALLGLLCYVLELSEKISDGFGLIRIPEDAVFLARD